MFLKLLEQEISSLMEKVSMTKNQRKTVSKMSKTGWTIVKQDKDKTTMKKDGKEVFVYNTGKTFFINEGKEEAFLLMDAVLEAMDDD